MKNKRKILNYLNNYKTNIKIVERGKIDNKYFKKKSGVFWGTKPPLLDLIIYYRKYKLSLVKIHRGMLSLECPQDCFRQSR